MRSLLLFSIAILISTAVSSQGFSGKQGGHCYTLDIPDYMVKTYGLNDNATLQYQNTSKEAYTIVIVDTKDELEYLGLKFVDSRDFLDGFMADYMKDAKNRSQSSVTEFKSNNNSHSQVELRWEKDDLKFYMLITVVETKTHFYKILCWTTLENVEKLKNDYLTISKSLKD